MEDNQTTFFSFPLSWKEGELNANASVWHEEKTVGKDFDPKNRLFWPYPERHHGLVVRGTHLWCGRSLDPNHL